MSATLLAAVALLAWPAGGPRVRRRLGLGPRAGTGPEFAAVLGGLPAAASAGIAGAVAGALAGTGLVAVLAGACSAVAGHAWSAGRRRLRDEADLVGLADGLAALGAELRAGRPPEDAARRAAEASGRPRCARALIRAVVPSATPPPLSATGPAPPCPAEPFTEAVRRISVAATLSARTGCSLAAVIGAVEDDLRVRLGHARELRSQTAGPRASVALLAGLPLLGLAMGSGVGADPWHELTATGTGQLLLVLGVVLELTGIAWSARLTARALR